MMFVNEVDADSFDIAHCTQARHKRSGTNLAPPPQVGPAWGRGVDSLKLSALPGQIDPRHASEVKPPPPARKACPAGGTVWLVRHWSCFGSERNVKPLPQALVCACIQTVKRSTLWEDFLSDSVLHLVIFRLSRGTHVLKCVFQHEACRPLR